MCSRKDFVGEKLKIQYYNYAPILPLFYTKYLMFYEIFFFHAKYNLFLSFLELISNKLIRHGFSLFKSFELVIRATNSKYSIYIYIFFNIYFYIFIYLLYINIDFSISIQLFFYSLFYTLIVFRYLNYSIRIIRYIILLI